MKKCILLLLIITVIILSVGCADRDITKYKYDKHNIFGLQEIKIDGEIITLIFNKKSVPIYSSIEYPNPMLIRSEEFEEECYFHCYDGPIDYESSDHKCEIKGNKIYLSCRCPDADKVRNIALGGIYIIDISSPKLTYYDTLACDYVAWAHQEYNLEKKEWEEVYWTYN